MAKHNSFIIIVTAFSVQIFMFSLVMAVVSNITTDQQALLTLKACITHDPNNLLVNNWSTSTSVCDWIGVTCGARHHTVTVLNISYFGLEGTIPPQLGNLSFLEVFVIRNNSFHGSLPAELAQLGRLKSLDVTLNSFTMEIPSWFASLPKLEDLLLGSNNFIGTIPPSLGNISSLEVLSLRNNQLSGTIPSSIFNLSSLEILDLRFNELSGDIPRGIGNLTRLKKIYFANNRLQGKIPQELGNLAELDTLWLRHNALIGSIPSLMFNVSSLTSVDFSNNSLTGTLPDNMCQHLPLLNGLFMSNNQLTGQIPKGLWQCRSLKSISLSNNQFEGKIPRDIGNLTLVTELYLYNNNLIGEIPREMGNLAKLKILSLTHNALTGLIPSSISNLSKIEQIGLSMNSLSGTLPPSFGDGLPNLKELNLWYNKLHGFIPNSIANASQLTILQLQANSFSGPVPTTLGNLRNLRWLSIAYNQLTIEPSSQELSFLSSLTYCKHLTVLILDDNPLNGTLPVSIGNLTALNKFEADNCKVKGSIPYEIGNLRYLINLRLGNNELIGTIPTAVGKMRMLQVLDLVGNRLQGFIPNEICNLRNLGELHLSENKFFGSVPACLGDVTSLRVLLLNSNNLSSTIPSSLWNLEDILQLDLSRNSFSGRLPLGMEKLRALFHLELARNKFSGEIPSNIANIQTLINFSMAHNKLKGRIPESFGNLISLEFLDISSNNLSGVIPNSLENLKYLKYLNVSFNRLEGKIPTGGAFANLSAESFMGNGQLCGAQRLKVPPCKSGTNRQSKKTKLVILVCVLLSITSAIVLVALTIFWCRSRRRKADSLDRKDVSTLATWRRISYEELYDATNGFEESNLLGIGGFGSIYKGKLLDGKDVAVKVFNLQEERALRSFDDECEVMSKICHRNLVKIISCCSNFDFKALVLEYMPNGSLEKWLYSHDHCVDMIQRMNIMIDVAMALEYLHYGYGTTIVHSDLKPSNVMLDEDMVAHVGDFGIAKLLGEENTMTQTHTLATIGYMAPEYGSEGIVSVRGDVYSFGILLMETFTRKKPTDNIFEEGMSLKCWVRQALPHSVNEVADVNLLGEENFTATKDCISSILELAVDCTVDLPERRLDISNVLKTLANIRARFRKIVATNEA